ncbi:MAG: class I SAM-dependent methyltransferase [Actinomycetota bacterium]|nr:class I SAM-dependent methyltransferase [Actinomycetota bacterium]
MSGDSEGVEAARAAVAANSVWYHTIELAPGVVTPGYTDWRKVVERILPDDLSGKRCLDIGTFDGFWAFEMERRGAEVVAIDVEKIDDAEWPPHRREQLKREQDEAGVELGRGFEIASRALGSRVRRVICPYYELTAEAIGGPVDLIFSGAILLHLRDPVRGLERARAALAPAGVMRALEPISTRLTLLSRGRPAASFEPLTTPFNWWVPNLAGIDAWFQVAGFERAVRPTFVRPGGHPSMRERFAALTYRPAGEASR